MRLLYFTDDDTFCFTPDLTEDVPPYAILSHTWGVEDQEVLYSEIESNSAAAKQKEGYKKLLFCMKQARIDGLAFYWIDTCCIDKRNFTEYAEAINSMFRWYARARKCYVYLVDVQLDDEEEWERAFRASRWFTRGWTLQELLAPPVVEFFTVDGQPLGTRTQHAEMIQSITGIETEALQGHSLASFDMERRLNWAQGRQTKKPEDEVYSLLGICGVSMTLNYAEGKEKALRRLKKEIADQQAHDAGDTVIERFHLPGPMHKHSMLDVLNADARLERRYRIVEHLSFSAMDARRSTIESALDNTCQWILEHPKFVTWVTSNTTQLLWIKGHPGAGKSTIMKYIDYHMAERLKNTPNLLLRFYFNARGSHLESSVTGMYRSLIIQLLKGIPSLGRVLDELEFGHAVPPEPSFFADATPSILRELFESLVMNAGFIRFNILLDAVDETDEETVLGAVYFLQRLGQAAGKRGSTILTCLASRHYPTLNIPTHLRLVLDREPGHKQDLMQYIDVHLHVAGPQVARLTDDILAKANGIFLWVILVISILNREYRTGNVFLVQTKLQHIPRGMSELLESISQHGDVDMQDFSLCLQLILFAQRPLKLEEFYFGMLAGRSDAEHYHLEWRKDELSRETMENFLLSNSKGLAELSKSYDPVVQFIHESVADFLVRHNGLTYITSRCSRDNAGSTGHEMLKQCCRRALVSGPSLEVDHTSSSFGNSDSSEDLTQSTTAINRPFLLYAAQAILYHSEEASKTICQREFYEDFPTQRWCNVADALSLMKNEKKLGNRLNAQSAMHYLFHFALARRQRELLQACLQVTPEVLTSTDVTGKTGFMWSVIDDQPELMEILISAGADVHISDAYGQTALHFGQSYRIDALRILLSEELNVDAEDCHGRSPVHILSASDDTEKLKVFLQAGPNVNATDFEGRTALHYAVEGGSLKCTQALLEAGIDVNAADDKGQVALHIAARGQLIDILRTLLRGGAFVNAFDHDGKTALYYADYNDTSRNVSAAARLLLTYNAFRGARHGRPGRSPPVSRLLSVPR